MDGLSKERLQGGINPNCWYEPGRLCLVAAAVSTELIELTEDVEIEPELVVGAHSQVMARCKGSSLEKSNVCCGPEPGMLHKCEFPKGDIETGRTPASAIASLIISEAYVAQKAAQSVEAYRREAE